MSVMLPLPPPDRLPSSRMDLVAALRSANVAAWVLPALAEPARRAVVWQRMTRLLDRWAKIGAVPREPAHRLAPPTGVALAEQLEHDRYFEITRVGGDGGVGFVAGLVLAHVAAYENCLDMGVTLLDGPDWERLFGGLTALIAIADGGSAAGAVPPLPLPARWREGYDPAARWLLGHQLFFALIQGAIVGLNCFASARAAGAADEADAGLRLAAAFMRSSAAAMKLTSDFAPEDYDGTVRPAMAPPAVRAGFSGLQTRDHAYLVRLFAALKPVLGAGERNEAHEEFIESVVTAYAAHEFICARFRGDVLPSLRMAASTRGKSQRSGVEVIRDMMRARLALVAGDRPAGTLR